MRIVVCGRGNGESILIGFSDNEWIVVDSFINPRTSKPAAISYLLELGLDPSQVIKAVVLTHAHEDHIKGMAEVIKSTLSGTKIVLSNALTTKESIEYFASIHTINSNLAISGVKEFMKVLDVIKSENRIGDLSRVGKGTLIYASGDFIVEALSPSQADVLQSEKDFVSMMATSTQSGISQVAPYRNPNNFCIALNIHNLKTQECILLGSDLEITGHPSTGWDSAVNSYLINNRQCVQYFKIPHHGSANGIHQYTWDNLIKRSATCVMTTFNTSSLPRQAEVQYFRKVVSELYCATRPKYSQSLVLPKYFDKTAMKIVTKNISPKTAYGHVVTEKTIVNNQMQATTAIYGDAIRL